MFRGLPGVIDMPPISDSEHEDKHTYKKRRLSNKMPPVEFPMKQLIDVVTDEMAKEVIAKAHAIIEDPDRLAVALGFADSTGPNVEVRNITRRLAQGKSIGRKKLYKTMNRKSRKSRKSRKARKSRKSRKARK